MIADICRALPRETQSAISRRASASSAPGRFLKGYIEAIHFLVHNKAETITIFSDYLGARDPKVIEFFYGEIAGRVEKNLSPDPDSVRFTLDFIGRVNPKAKEIKVTDFSDPSLLQEIQKSGFIEKLYR